MKKIISILLCIALLACTIFSLSFTTFATTTSDEDPTNPTMPKLHTIVLNTNFFSRYSQAVYLIGDSDLNDSVSVTDATEIQRYLAHVDDLEEPSRLVSDVDFSENISIFDATCVQRYIAQIETPNSCCGDHLAVIDHTPVMPTTPSVTENYLYFSNIDRWESVYVYYWSLDESYLIDWPGEQMEFVGTNDYGIDIYRMEVPQDAAWIIFNDGHYNQTEDILIEGKNKIFYDNNWYDYYDYY